MIPLALQTATAMVVTAIAIRELVQLARHPSDLPLRLIVPGLICLAFAASAGIPEIRTPLDDALGGALTILVNLCSMSTAYCYAGFFIVANNKLPRLYRRRVVRRELLPLSLTALLLVVIWMVSPPDIHAHPVAISTAARWQTSALIGVVAIYALSFWILGSRRALAYRRDVEQLSLKPAISILVAGAAGMVAQYATGLVITTLYWFLPATSPVYSVLKTLYLVNLLGGQTLLAAGLAFPSLLEGAVLMATGYDRIFQRRAEPWTAILWRVLTVRFPYIRLPDTSSHRERVINEITDGLTRLGPYGDDVTGSAGIRSARVAARYIAAALSRVDAERQARWAGELTWERREAPYPRIEPDFPNWRARMRWMAIIGRTLAYHGIPDPGQPEPGNNGLPSGA